MHQIHNPDTVHAPVSTYSHALEVSSQARWLYLSGQVGMTREGEIPAPFAEQCELAWANLFQVLACAGMNQDDLVKVTVFMVREEDLSVFRAIRDRFLGGARPASTLLFVKALARPEWLIPFSV